MKRSVMIMLCLIVAIPLLGRSIHTHKEVSKVLPKKIPFAQEPIFMNNTLGPNHTFGLPPRYENRNSDWISSLIDSSKNGYGPYNGSPNPLAYAHGEGYLTVYRQWQGLDATAGYIGAAQSLNGELWFVEQTINTVYPSGEVEGDSDFPTYDARPQGRYPSAAYTAGAKPTAVWNESSLVSQGGGTSVDNVSGFPLWAYDTQGLDAFSFWATPNYMNTGCTGLPTVPCDPGDLWVGNVLMSSDNGTPVLNAIYNGWSDNPYRYYQIKSSASFGGFFQMAAPYVIADDGQLLDNGDSLWFASGGYTSSPDYHINDNGVGYMGQMGYSFMSDTEEPKLHTFWFKKTTDHGATWTTDEGYNNTGYKYINDATLIRLSDSLYTLWSENPEDYPEQLWYADAVCDSLDETTGDVVEYACGDSIFYSNVDGACLLTPGIWFYYDFDMRTDVNGGLHLTTVALPYVCPENAGIPGLSGGCEDNDQDGLADSLYLEGRFGSGGHYYFYNPDPWDNPNNWRASLLNDLSTTYYADWDVSDIPHLGATDGYGPETYFHPAITLSGEGRSPVIWYAGSKGSAFALSQDSLYLYPQDIDIYMRKSYDLGLTWTDLENVTNTPGSIEDKHLEVGVHLATTGSNNDVGVFYQVPDFNTLTYSPATGYEDYMNWVYVGIYSNDTGGGGVPLANDHEDLGPNSFALKQNYPNPFNPITKIKYDLEKSGDVLLEIFDIRGHRVKTLLDEFHVSGSHELTFDGSQMASGVYFYTMTASGINKTRKLVLMK